MWQALAGVGLAPTLVGVYPLDPADAGWSAVVMHFVETRDVDINAEEEVDAVKAAAAHLHDFGFVHGDLREPNVKVSWSQGNVVHCE